MSKTTAATIQSGWPALHTTLDRFKMLYKRFDTVTVSFSGGQRSTLCLRLALDVARALNKLPVQAYFWDEEIHPETVEYVDCVRLRDDVRLIWLCLPVKHHNACSQQYWYCWHPKKKSKWRRQMPSHAISSAKWFRMGMTIPKASPLVYGHEYGTVAHISGMKRLEETWLGGSRDGRNYTAWPIYDWTLADVRDASERFGWDYEWP